MRWAVFGTYDVTKHPRVAVLIEGLVASGDEVVEINEPLRLDTAGRVAMLRQPWRLPVFAGKLLRCWTVLARRSRALRRSAPPDAVLVGYLGHFDVRLARRLFGATPIVLDHLVSAAGTARDRGLAGSGGLKARLMRAIDGGALSRADVVVVDTAEHEAALPPSAAARAIIAPVGATAEWFAVGRTRLAAAQPRLAVSTANRPTHRDKINNLGRLHTAEGVQTSKIDDHREGRERGSRSALRVVFVGLFTPLHGTRTVGEALAQLAGEEIDITMVGSGQEYEVCRAAAAGNDRVRWVDWVPSAQLPAVVGAHDVSLGIFGTTPKALNVVPTKVYQGAAAACAIVTSDTPPQREAPRGGALSDAALRGGALSDAALRGGALSDAALRGGALGAAAVFVPPGDATALANALRRLAEDRSEVARLGAAAHQLAEARYTATAVVAGICTSLRSGRESEGVATHEPTA